MHTVTLKIQAPPKHTRKMSANQIVAYLRHHHRTDKTGKRALNKTTAHLKAISNAIFDPTYWKNPCQVEAALANTEWVKATIIWYHGAEPKEIAGGSVVSEGYACW